MPDARSATRPSQIFDQDQVELLTEKWLEGLQKETIMKSLLMVITKRLRLHLKNSTESLATAKESFWRYLEDLQKVGDRLNELSIMDLCSLEGYLLEVSRANANKAIDRRLVMGPVKSIGEELKALLRKAVTATLQQDFDKLDQKHITSKEIHKEAEKHKISADARGRETTRNVLGNLTTKMERDSEFAAVPVQEESEIPQLSVTAPRLISVESEDSTTAARLEIQEKGRKRATIGIKGGRIELPQYGSKVSFPKEAVASDTEFTVTIDNNPASYPKTKFAIAPIIDVEPSMDFAVPVSVTMRTWFSASVGETLGAQILHRTEDGNWIQDQEIVLSDKNEITFEVKHFSGRVAAVSEGSSVDGDAHLINSVYMHKGSGVIISTFSKEKTALKEAEGHFREHKKVLIPPAQIRGKVNSILKVELDCHKPTGVKYYKSPMEIKASEAFTKDYQSIYFRPENFPPEHKVPFVADYRVKVRGVSDGNEDMQLDAVLTANQHMNSATSERGGEGTSPSRSNTGNVSVVVNSTAAYQGDVDCHKSESQTAQIMANKGGTLTRNEHGTANQMSTGKQ